VSGATLTAWILLAACTLAGGYDVLAYNMYGADATVTHVIRVWNHNYPILGVAVGAVIGHLFWQ
jgi:hypothetical protein